jgi:diguanylate cyclase (GGDEF)-like protein
MGPKAPFCKGCGLPRVMETPAAADAEAMAKRMRFPSPQEIHSDTRLPARVIGGLYSAGAALVGISLLLPHPADSNDGAILALAGVAAVVAALLLTLDRRLPGWLLQVVIGLGSALISLCVYFTGQPSAYAAMFIWVVLAAAFFFPGRRTAVQVVWLLAVYAAVLYSIPSEGYSPTTQLFLTTIAFGTAAAVVSWLSEAASRRAEVSESRARTDPLTGIANRRWLDEELTRELAWAKRHRAPLCVAIVDLDDLKQFNDRHGHLAGDHLLVSAVGAWRSALRPSDFLARIGGDEFMLVFPDCSAESALAVLARVRMSTPGGASCSAGATLWDEQASAMELFQRADAALYEAKRDGGDQTVLLPLEPGTVDSDERLLDRILT